MVVFDECGIVPCHEALMLVLVLCILQVYWCSWTLVFSSYEVSPMQFVTTIIENVAYSGSNVLLAAVSWCGEVSNSFGNYDCDIHSTCLYCLCAIWHNHYPLWILKAFPLWMLKAFSAFRMKWKELCSMAKTFLMMPHSSSKYLGWKIL